MQNNNWNEWKRMQINIDKAQYNQKVTELTNQHYTYLHSKLVQYYFDEDIFNDTYLKLTRYYNPEKDFVNQFCYIFNLLKGAYYRDSKVTNWLETSIEDNSFEIVDNEEEYTEEENITKDIFLNKLKQDLNAISK